MCSYSFGVMFQLFSLSLSLYIYNIYNIYTYLTSCMYVHVRMYVICSGCYSCVCVCLAPAESESDAEKILFSYGFGARLPTTARRRAQQRCFTVYIRSLTEMCVCVFQCANGPEGAPIRTGQCGSEEGYGGRESSVYETPGRGNNGRQCFFIMKGGVGMA